MDYPNLNNTRLEAHKITLAYDNKKIITDLSLAIPSEKITILIGANGCGKSTLLKGLSRILKPEHGTVYLDGKAISKLSSKKIAQTLGILPQNPTSPEGLTVKELVAQGRYPYQNWWQQWSKEDEILVNQALMSTDLISFADRPLDTLSGGQRQRAWIAMSLAQNTDILLLDEPTTFLDLAHQIEILDLLRQLNKTRHKTLVIVLHDLNLASRYADYLVAVKQGKIYAQGTPEIVMSEEVIKAVFNLESHILPDPVTQKPMCIPIKKLT
ncbi:ABC transporter ATP-binding protein [Crocosphaera chwakensis]|uniref:ATP-binding protein of ferrichrome ABC transporter n=1 Tax=Crocosphaera chwakensis CCY0110 TaxID=391612 RepID=A3ISC8_9CHRO|nr:ABC transporter ATP-binding protein [Crocosphaera chwakensis]EAZ90644.1 ATP-binding protein of ferrichrome ABC transporter [Crocosphaera chwakensis CCY0110]